MFYLQVLALFIMLTAFFPANILALSSTRQKISKTKTLSIDGKLATRSMVNGPNGLAIDQRGNLFIAEMAGNKVRRVDAVTKIVTTVAGNGKNGFSGDGGPATLASLDFPLAVLVDRKGNLFISDIGGHVRKVDAVTKIITTVLGNGTHVGDISSDSKKAVDVSLGRPSGLAFDSKENLYVADDIAHCIRRVDKETGLVTIVAGGGSSLGDDGLAEQANLNFPMGIAFDKDDNLFIADYQNNRIRRVDARTKIITTIAGNGADTSTGDGGPAVIASLNYPGSIAVDDYGNIFLVEGAKDRVRRVDSRTGIITTVAGNGKKGFSGDKGLASKARLNNPAGVAVDRAGNIFITEYVNNRVRRVDVKTGVINTVAGNGLPHRIDLQL